MLPETYIPGFHKDGDVDAMKYNRLGKTDMRLSAMSFGAAGLGNVYGKVEDNAVQIVTHALKSGINYIDTAPFYGERKSEETVGKVISQLPRKAFYISTKVGRYKLDPVKMFNYTYDHIISEFYESLRLLQLDYVDLVFVHDVEFSSVEQVIKESIPALQKLREEKKCRYIGISGYPLALLQEIAEKSVVKLDAVLTYARCTLHDNSLLDYLSWFREKGIGVINASATAMGLYTLNGPQPWHPASDEIKLAVRQAALYCQENNMDISRLGIRHSLENAENVASLLITCTSIKQVDENLYTYRTPLTSNEKLAISHILNRFLNNLTKIHWENVEKERIATHLKQLQDK